MPSSDYSLPSSLHEKDKYNSHRSRFSWTRPILIPIPGISNRRFRIYIPTFIPFRSTSRRRGPLLLSFTCLALFLTVLVLRKHSGSEHWPPDANGNGNGDNSNNNNGDNENNKNEPSTLVFQRLHLQRIWKWEIASGHYPSSQNIPKQIRLTVPPMNPALPPRTKSKTSLEHQRAVAAAIALNVSKGLDGDDMYTLGVGSKRVYLDIQSRPPNVAYPPRPVPGSVADMDVLMRHCDFSENKYVRDCLEVLRVGAGLDNGQRTRREGTEDWNYIYLEQGPGLDPKKIAEEKQLRMTSGSSFDHDTSEDEDDDDDKTPEGVGSPPITDSNYGLVKKSDSEWESSIVLPSVSLRTAAATTTPLLPQSTSILSPSSLSSTSNPCDPENPRLFHMFWTGPFTDKPYLAILSFLYTQNTGLHLTDPELIEQHRSKVCVPQFWMWINPGPAATVPNPTALKDMFAGLKRNPWAAPFLHRRFRDIVKFKLWNTTEQLDGVREIREEWRKFPTLFNSAGQVFSVKQEKQRKIVTGGGGTGTGGEGGSSSQKEDVGDDLYANDEDDDSEDVEVDDADEDEDGDDGTEDQAEGGGEGGGDGSGDLADRTGSKSYESYDRLSVILSDMARFILCHRFGGIYLDADTIFLRDWEELWGWKGAFAYRWSRLEKYNTAVLRMHKGSALGSFLFRTALKNGLDFHPMTVARYTKDAYLEGLLLRLPDAFFDSAWLNTEFYQRDRPPQPYFTEFSQFFETPAQNSAAPQALGFNGFFRGAFSYHFHNFWWKPFDPSRNWPDLGPRFKAGEDQARATLEEEEERAAAAAAGAPGGGSPQLVVTRRDGGAGADADADENEGGEDGLSPSSPPPSTSSSSLSDSNSNSTSGSKPRPRSKSKPRSKSNPKPKQKSNSNSRTKPNATARRKTRVGTAVTADKRDLDWSTVLKRTFEAYLRGERPNMYGEYIRW